MPILIIASMIAVVTAASDIAYSPQGTVVGGQKWFEQRCQPLPTGWRKQGCEFGELATVNLLEVRHDRLFWNGDLIDERALRDYIARSLRLSPSPGIALVVDPASSRKQASSIRRTVAHRFGCNPEKVCVEYTASEWKRAQPPARGNVR